MESLSMPSNQWTPEEDALLHQLVHQYGNQWAKIALFFPGRQGISIRNRCCKLSRQSNGDPYLRDILNSVNHKQPLQISEQDPSPLKLPSCISLLEMTSKPEDLKMSSIFKNFPQWIESIQNNQISLFC